MVYQLVYTIIDDIIVSRSTLTVFYDTKDKTNLVLNKIEQLSVLFYIYLDLTKPTT